MNCVVSIVSTYYIAINYTLGDRINLRPSHQVTRSMLPKKLPYYSATTPLPNHQLTPDPAE